MTHFEDERVIDTNEHEMPTLSEPQLSTNQMSVRIDSDCQPQVSAHCPAMGSDKMSASCLLDFCCHPYKPRVHLEFILRTNINILDEVLLELVTAQTLGDYASLWSLSIFFASM